MPSYRYTLQPYKGPASRYICPQCNSRRKTFVRYIDTQTGEQLPDHVGRCGRQDSCGYHFTPKQFLENNGTTYEPAKQRRRKSGKQSGSKTPKKPAYTSFIPDKDWQASLKHYERNNLVQYILKMFGGQATRKLLDLYHIGTSKKWDGATIFWQLDRTLACHTGKIMLYNKDTGRRVKEPYNHVSWVHTLYPDFKLKQCLFGEHLLAGNTKLVTLVESEKTALIGTIYYPDRIWIATGGKEAFTKERCRSICNRDVLILPDMGSYDHWAAKAKENLKFYKLLDPPPGAKDGEDIADWLMDR